MQPESKRMLTAADWDSQAAHDNHLLTSTPPDLALQLRNLGARVRRNVSQGYVLPPSSSSFSRSATSDAIFRSANDTLRDVLSTTTASASALGASSSPGTPKKRNRAASDSPNPDGISLDGDEMQVDAQRNTPLRPDERPMKPLRRTWTRKSVSDSVLALPSNRDAGTFAALDPASELDEEEDWSAIPQDSSSSEATVTPLQALSM
ncbi:hypothetical protein FA15DRAFT_664797 [Coprinopsis marcescibilis]|uniref:Uncharacterized protein n=1 Tax=Coprinopsis marcescibilis TaxID=230819 RepID=A0A5C3L8D1_COPMA|nr:hypothetical protein FA15DRAFT_664797 [Coprinopsis marcescibilis]